MPTFYRDLLGARLELAPAIKEGILRIQFPNFLQLSTKHINYRIKALGVIDLLLRLARNSRDLIGSGEDLGMQGSSKSNHPLQTMYQL
jgi:hypothetical protein